METWRFPRIQRFSLTGVVTELEIESGPHPKVIFVQAHEETYRVKLAKPARKSLEHSLNVGDRINLEGEREYHRDNGQFRYKAYALNILESASSPASNLDTSLDTSSRPKASTVKQGKILVCQKSSCCQRGGKAVWQRLNELIQENGLEAQISLKATGCMGECKHGPALVIMPGKNRFTHVTPAQVPQLLAGLQP
jgi:hypothetical protein